MAESKPKIKINEERCRLFIFSVSKFIQFYLLASWKRNCPGYLQEHRFIACHITRQYLIYFHKLTLQNQSIQDIIKNWVCLLAGSHEYIFRFADEITASYLFNLCSLDNIDRI